MKILRGYILCQKYDCFPGQYKNIGYSILPEILYLWLLQPWNEDLKSI